MPVLTKTRLSKLFGRLLGVASCHRHTGEDIAVCLDCDRTACIKCDPGFCSCRGVKVAEADQEAVDLGKEILLLPAKNEAGSGGFLVGDFISLDAILPALRKATQKKARS